MATIVMTTQDGPSLDMEMTITNKSDPLLLGKHRAAPSFVAQQPKHTHAYYAKQNAQIDNLLDTASNGHVDGAVSTSPFINVAVLSLGANIILLSLLLAGALISGSLSLLATAADSLMDVASSTVLVAASKFAQVPACRVYPAGRARAETAGIVVFSTLMATLSLQLVVEAVRSIANGEHNISIGVFSIVFVSTALVIKLLLFIYCSSIAKDPTARILAQDHRNDLLLNSTGILFGLLGMRLHWIIDPIGGIVIALLILRTWATAAHEHIAFIVGKSADPDFLQKITYIAMTHDERITQIDTCRAYHSGNKFLVEVDIVLPASMPLGEAHDIGEALQITLEDLEDVERAFVHLDYETSHKPEHQKTK